MKRPVRRALSSSPLPSLASVAAAALVMALAPDAHASVEDASASVAASDAGVASVTFEISGVNGQPASSAVVFLDGQRVLDAPDASLTTPLTVAAGDHKVRVEFPDGAPIEQVFSVQAGEARTMRIQRNECEQMMGGVAPHVERSATGCCGKPAPVYAARSGPLAALAAAAVLALRRRKR